MATTQTKKTKRAPNAEPPFPRRCRHCGEQEVVLSTTEYEAEVRHEGHLHTFMIPDLELPVCQACGERVFTKQADKQVNDALHAHLHLLTPTQIRDGIKRLGMSQKTAAARLGIAEETLSRWLTETQIHSRAMDNLLRVFFAFPQIRTALCGELQSPELGLSQKMSETSRPGDEITWTNKLAWLVGKCIHDERNGRDMRATGAWDAVCEYWHQCEQETPMNKSIVADEYLGDGVYASFDGYRIWLRGQDNFTKIALEPAVLLALAEYTNRCSAACEAERTGNPNNAT